MPNAIEILQTKVDRRKFLRGASAFGATVLAACGLGSPNASRVAEGTASPSPTASPTEGARATATPTPAATVEPTPGAAGKGPGGAEASPAAVPPEVGEVKLPIWEKGKPIIHSRIGPRGNEIVQQIDVGTFGPDVDAICGFDFKGNIPTGATVISRPTTGPVLETRVVFIKRTDLMYVQINDALGGDESHVQKARDLFPTAKEADENLDKIARLHARNSAHTHQKVVYLGDLGRFEDEWGQKERALLNRIIWAQRPAKPEIGIQDSNFVFARRFT